MLLKLLLNVVNSIVNALRILKKAFHNKEEYVLLFTLSMKVDELSCWINILTEKYNLEQEDADALEESFYFFRDRVDLIRMYISEKGYNK